MPFFKSTYNILVDVEGDEVYDANRYDSDTLQLPPSKEWDYSRPLTVEDIDIWEIIHESSGGLGVYAAWMPYAEFYMVTTGFNPSGSKNIEVFYGPGSQAEVFKYAKQLGLPLSITKQWVDDKDMWLYEKKIMPTENS